MEAVPIIFGEPDTRRVVLLIPVEKARQFPVGLDIFLQQYLVFLPCAHRMFPVEVIHFDEQVVRNEEYNTSHRVGPYSMSC